MSYSLRPFRSDDAPRLNEIFVAAVRTIGPRGYSLEQVDAWAARSPAAEAHILERAAQGQWIVVAADENDVAVAYALLEKNGHLDHLYCHPQHTRYGLADDLLKAAETKARSWSCAKMYTEASELARPAFERAGYEVIQRRDFTIEHDGKLVPIHNFAMEKALK